MSINLLPDELKETRKLFTSKSPLIKGIILYGIFFLITNGFLWWRVGYLEQKLFEKQILVEETEKIIKNIELGSAEIELILTQQDILKEQLNKKSHAAEIFQKIQFSLPNKINLTRMYFNDKGRIIIFGETHSMEILRSFLDNLEKEDAFEYISLSELSKKQNSGLNSFQLELLSRNGERSGEDG